MAVRKGIVLLVGGGDVGVVVFVAGENKEFLSAFLVDEPGQDIIAALHAGGEGLLPDRGLLVGRIVGGEVPLDGGQGHGVAHPSVVRISSDNQAFPLIGEVERSQKGMGLDVGVTGIVEVVRIGRVHGLSIVAAQAEPQVFHRVIVHPQDGAVVVGDPPLIGRGGAIMDKMVAVEQKAVQRGDHLGLIAPVRRAAPQADACLVPGRRQDGALPFRTVDRKEVQGFVGMVQSSDGDDQVANPKVQRRKEAFLEPELFELHFSAFFHLAFPFSGLGKLLFDRRTRSAVLEFNLCLHGPAFPEVVAQIDDGMGNVEAAVRRLVGIRLGPGITVDIVRVEITAEGDLTIAADRQPLGGCAQAHAQAEDDTYNPFHKGKGSASAGGRQSQKMMKRAV